MGGLSVYLMALMGGVSFSSELAELAHSLYFPVLAVVPEREQGREDLKEIMK